ncbi:hypothetical protein [Methylobacillus rhizosphaerae]|uniref:hypothetical protein n=1 Tax=Methylobacillus rhizosphaerae TaxID=551994 RepID=UPI00117C6C59|nr:hypothetical protein [Methylobacillus rhizosphaerae]
MSVVPTSHPPLPFQEPYGTCRRHSIGNQVKTSSEQQANESTESYPVKSAATATRLNTSSKEMPQFTSVLTRELIVNFRLTSVNDVLDIATGRMDRAEMDAPITLWQSYGE